MNILGICVFAGFFAGLENVDHGFRSIDLIAEDAFNIFSKRLLEYDALTQVASHESLLQRQSCRCPLAAYVRSGSQALSKLLHLCVEHVCGRKGHEPDKHAFHASTLASAYKWSWDATKRLLLYQFSNLGLANRSIIILVRNPYENIISNSLHSDVPFESWKDFGMEFSDLNIERISQLRDLDHARLQHQFLDVGKSIEIFSYVRFHYVLRQAALESSTRVLTLFYHEALADPRNFIERALDFCNLTRNRSTTQEVQQLARLIQASWKEKPGMRETSVSFRYRHLYADKELVWAASILRDWNPKSPPWLVEESEHRKSWALHPNKPAKNFVYDGVASITLGASASDWAWDR